VSASASVTVPAAAACDRSIEARRAAQVEKFKRERLVIDYLNRGVSVREIAVKLGVTEKRMRAIVKEVLAAHMPGPPEEFVALQISRLNEALLVAYSAMSGTNLKAVDRVVKIARELDRYHGFFPAERGSLPDARRPALTEPKAEEPLALLAEGSGMAMQVPGIAVTAACHSRGSGNPDAPHATSLPLAPVVAGMTEEGNGDRPQTAPQATERAQFAPGSGMVMASADPQGVASAPGPAVASLTPAQGALAPMRRRPTARNRRRKRV
jgi:hypothetical protein